MNTADRSICAYESFAAPLPVTSRRAHDAATRTRAI
jgi:hypothetical protein